MGIVVFRQIKIMIYGDHTINKFAGSLVEWVECSLIIRETWVQSPGRVISKTLKMVFDTFLLKTQQYKLRIKGKVEQSRERSSALLYTLV